MALKMALSTQGTKSKNFRVEYIRYNLGRIPRISNQKIREFGVVLRPLQLTLGDTAEFFINNRWLDADRLSDMDGNTDANASLCTVS